MTAVGKSGVVRSEEVDAGQLAGVSAEPAQVGHRVVVGLEDVDVSRRETEVGAVVGAETGRTEDHEVAGAGVATRDRETRGRRPVGVADHGEVPFR